MAARSLGEKNGKKYGLKSSIAVKTAKETKQRALPKPRQLQVQSASVKLVASTCKFPRVVPAGGQTSNVTKFEENDSVKVVCTPLLVIVL